MEQTTTQEARETQRDSEVEKKAQYTHDIFIDFWLICRHAASPPSTSEKNSFFLSLLGFEDPT